jgi:hypothetical protein
MSLRNSFSCLVALVAFLSPVFAGETPVKIAVFAFELEDATPAAALLGKETSAAASLEKVTKAAREALAASGRYALVDVAGVAAKPAIEKSLRNCDGCEAALALELGADESLLGVVSRATQTDYYVAIVIRNAKTGKIVDQQAANFAGSEDGWPTGVKMLIKHQILVSSDQGT